MVVSQEHNKLQVFSLINFKRVNNEKLIVMILIINVFILTMAIQILILIKLTQTRIVMILILIVMIQISIIKIIMNSNLLIQLITQSAHSKHVRLYEQSEFNTPAN